MRILHLYRDLLNLYGEYGNVEILFRHLQDQGYETEIFAADLKAKFNFDDFDFIYCGSGLESNLKVALKDIQRHKEGLIDAINKNKCILFTGNSMELLGESIDDIPGLNIAPIYSHTTSKRFTGDVIVKNKDFGELVGFINRSSIVVNYADDPLFEYVFKDPSLKDENRFEGYRIKNLIGTHLIGPILVKNPELLKFYITEILHNKDQYLDYHDYDYVFEKEAYDITLNELKKRIK